MAERKSVLEVVLMPLVLAIVGIVGTYLVTEQRQQASEAQAILERERADIVAAANRQVKILELFSDKIVSDNEDEQTLAIFSTLALDSELAAKLLPTFSINNEQRSEDAQTMISRIANAIVLARVMPDHPSATIEGHWLLNRSDEASGANINSMSIKVDEPGAFKVNGVIRTDKGAELANTDWTGEGKIEGAKGVYFWQFPDGRTGQTRIFLDSSGLLFGWVHGESLDWTYWAIKQTRD